MRSRNCLIVALFAALLAPPLLAENHFVVRTKGGSSAIQEICARLGCQFVRALDGKGNQVFHITTSESVQPSWFLQLLDGEDGVEFAEAVRAAALPETSPDVALNQSSVAVLNSLNDTRTVSYSGSTVRYSYVNQPAAQTLRIAETHKAFDIGGDGIVAVIDTGIDPNHPALKQWITSGYDFTRDAPGVPSELADLTQSTVAVLNQSTVAVLNQSTVAVLNQSTVAVLNDSRYPAFGHGTMIAGIIHLVAPKAKIMPLKVFRADGSANTADIARAIYYAVDNGAKVVSMSFSLSEFSAEIMRAVNYAIRKGVICVASAGNGGKETLVFPAAFGGVVGVGSTTGNDLRSSFSNFGPDLVWLAAPGEGVITTFPGSSYAAGWGTSFSTAFVSGAVALLLNVDVKTKAPQAADALSHAKSISEELGYGRLDLYEAVLARRKALGLQ